MMTGNKNSGRKPKGSEAMRVYPVRLSVETIDRLSKVDNASEIIREALEGKMKTANVTMAEGFREQYQQVADMDRYDLDNLESAILVRRNQIVARELQLAGFSCRLDARGETFRYVLVYDPTGDKPAEFASLDECRRLLDTAANLPPAEAFRRWREKIEPIESPAYTRADAVRDMREERAELKQKYEAGEISAEDYRLGHVAARDYLDLAE